MKASYFVNSDSFFKDAHNASVSLTASRKWKENWLTSRLDFAYRLSELSHSRGVRLRRETGLWLRKEFPYIYPGVGQGWLLHD